MLPPMHILTISCSLNPGSRSAILIHRACETLRAEGHDPGFIDLAQLTLPLCDGHAAYQHKNVAPAAEKVRAADGILLATPIYNYDVNAAAKNLVELTGADCWQGKAVGFLAAAGGQGSYMSLMPFANSLMLDFRCFIFPRYVYATGAAFENGEIVDPQVRTRVDTLARTFPPFVQAIASLREKEPQL